MDGLLKRYFEKSSNPADSAMARSLYNQICEDYYAFSLSDTTMLRRLAVAYPPVIEIK